MTRRKVLALLAGAAVAGPLMAVGQEAPRLRNIGVLMGLAEGDAEVPRRLAILRQALHELGWTEGQNIRIQYRAAIEVDQMRALAKELVALRPDVIVAGSTVVAKALLQETRTIPIVFATASDPVGDGLVTSLAQPSGNATGLTCNLSSLGSKWLELLREIAPDTAHFTAVYNPGSAPAGGAYFLPPLATAAASLSIGLDAAPVHKLSDIESTFASSNPTDGIVVLPDQFTAAHREYMVALAARHRAPAIYPFRSSVEAGGLMSYGIDVLDLYQRLPSYVDRILRGASVADLPVQSPAKVELVINLGAATALGLTVPRILLARADKVIG